MKRNELIELAKVRFDWKYLYESSGFRGSKETLKNGESFMAWSQETSSGDVVYWTDSEDGPALLATPFSSKVKWEKLDIILEFHCGGDWSAVLDLFTFNNGLEKGPIAEIARRTKEQDVFIRL